MYSIWGWLRSYTAQRLERLGLKSDPFYTMMAALGLENGAIVPLEVCASKGHCLKQEKFWMRKLGAVFNRHGVSHKFRGAKWANLKGPLRAHGWASADDIRQAARREASRLTTMTSSRDLLRILLDSKPFIDKELHSKLFHKVRAKIRLRHSITIPPHIPVPYAIHPHADIPCVRATGYCRAMAQCALQNYSAQHSARYGSGSWVCNPMS